MRVSGQRDKAEGDTAMSDGVTVVPRHL